jgi:hypothetical protein
MGSWHRSRSQGVPGPHHIQRHVELPGEVPPVAARRGSTGGHGQLEAAARRDQRHHQFLGDLLWEILMGCTNEWERSISIVGESPSTIVG